MCEQGHPQHRASISNSSFSSIKESLQAVIVGTPPPPYEAVASDIDKEEKAIKAGIDRSELFYAPIIASEETKPPTEAGFLGLKHSSKKIQTQGAKLRKEGKLAVDDNFLTILHTRKGLSGETGNVIEKRVLGKSLDDITSPVKRTIKSTSYCQLPSSATTSSNPRAVQHSTIARLNERPALDIPDLGFGTTIRSKDNNNYEVAC